MCVCGGGGGLGGGRGEEQVVWGNGPGMERCGNEGKFHLLLQILLDFFFFFFKISMSYFCNKTES